MVLVRAVEARAIGCSVTRCTFLTVVAGTVDGVVFRTFFFDSEADAVDAEVSSRARFDDEEGAVPAAGGSTVVAVAEGAVNNAFHLASSAVHFSLMEAWSSLVQARTILPHGLALSAASVMGSTSRSLNLNSTMCVIHVFIL
jgi:hypothetical protein